ncbi:BgTH12-07333 [Blumeria graminis f. sp. triticale]|uniref:BgTH12-07333 n=1 Tax=Blumeria graminis f. sp. triticale TaxID=1689686 RepID=A0A9W4GI95_BLUGR|nr:BgTH12-07333 [Blumeria graminis f. sp. triticale]
MRSPKGFDVANNEAKDSHEVSLLSQPEQMQLIFPLIQSEGNVGSLAPIKTVDMILTHDITRLRDQTGNEAGEEDAEYEGDSGYGITLYNRRGEGRRSTMLQRRDRPRAALFQELKPCLPRLSTTTNESISYSDSTNLRHKPFSDLIDELLEANYSSSEKSANLSSRPSLTSLSESSIASSSCKHSPVPLNSCGNPLEGVEISPSTLYSTPGHRRKSSGYLEKDSSTYVYPLKQASGLTPIKPSSIPCSRPVLRSATKYRTFSNPQASSHFGTKRVSSTPRRTPVSSCSSYSESHEIPGFEDKQPHFMHNSYYNNISSLKLKNSECTGMSNQSTTEERQRIISNNRSIRVIKNELESLLEREAISDDAYESIMSTLPAELSLNGTTGVRNAAKANVSATPAASNTPVNVTTNAMNSLQLGNNNQSSTPSLPRRDPVTPPVRPELTRAMALYRYAEPGDCNFEAGDMIAVYEYMNTDWWLGKNLRTGQEGVFPHNYVQVQPIAGPGMYSNEKANTYGNGYPGPYQAQAMPPPASSNPYNSSVPPMQVAEQQTTDGKPSKGGEMGKKIGKKLGNAAIFGAGATMGGNLVNSIF